jgi:hypothetical protein
VNPLPIPATGTVTASVFVLAEPDAIANGNAHGGTPIRFLLEDVARPGSPIVRDSTFLAPAAARGESQRKETRHGE